jgi:transposase
MPIPESRIAELAEFREARRRGLEYQRFLCVWLRVDAGMSTKEIVRIVGWHVNTVRSAQKAFIDEGVSVLVDKKTGGRMRQNMTLEEERLFLDRFFEAARSGSLVTARGVKAALEERLGREVHESTVYRLLHRHKWRKVVPRPRHPRNDKEAAEAFKKRASQIG